MYISHCRSRDNRRFFLDSSRFVSDVLERKTVSSYEMSILMKIFILFLCIAVGVKISAQSMVTVGGYAGTSFRNYSYLTYGPQANFQYAIGQKSTLSAGVGIGYVSEYTQYHIKQIGIGYSYYAKSLFDGFSLTPSVAIGFPNYSSSKLLGIGLGFGHMVKLYERLVFFIDASPNMGIVIGEKAPLTFGISGGLGLGYRFQ